ncbi:hypothetical protein N7491_010907 [Penicillium cf. griseofulvum]|uniref:Xylanolytic transcriptional activator regulatory domain-containing protein n=1 Tax=Penicillium cf. griseofulvum TaxID=2972120 RepID=A0A9W9N104_9EURO|nr:hypothetical protein N7472_001226 [Penicillium cf. griseofulvum]KAJ5422462.1 hypothetical protein N7491_010907 [Penicillium cf. griseofulvum]
MTPTIIGATGNTSKSIIGNLSRLLEPNNTSYCALGLTRSFDNPAPQQLTKLPHVEMLENDRTKHECSTLFRRIGQTKLNASNMDKARRSKALENELIETETSDYDSATQVVSNMLSASFPIPALSSGGQVISHVSLPVVTESQRINLLGSLRSMGVLMPDFDLPSSDSLTRFLAGYFTGFYPRMPFTHPPSFKIEACHPGIFLAMAAIGAGHRYEMKTAYNLFYVAKMIFLEKQRHRENNEFGRSANSTSLTSGRNNIQEIRGLLCLLAMASWQKDMELKNEYFMLQSLLASSVRLSGLDDTLIQDGDLDWETWAQQESDRRTKLLAFCFLNTQSIAYNLPPGLLSKEIRLRLPCSCPEWTAADATTWEMLRQNTPNEQEYFHVALQDLLSPTSGTRGHTSFTSPVANYVLLHGLIQSIIWTQQILPFSGGSLSSSSSRTLFEAALRRWTESWQTTPESNLEPLDPNGPLPFTSSALLSLAYIRNCVDTRCSQVLTTLDPVKIASALRNSPPLRHDWHLFLAAIHATRVLSTLVKLGVRYVQHSQSFVWSIEDALCGLECAVFLSQWLREVGDMTQKHSVSVLSTPDELATEVIKLWTLIMQGSSPWSFMGTVADVLIIYGGGCV